MHSKIELVQLIIHLLTRNTMANLLVLVLCINWCILAQCLPLEVNIDAVPAATRDTRSLSGFGFPTTENVMEKRPNNSCYEYFTTTMYENEMNEYGEQTMKEVNVTTRRCCENFDGAECNITITQQQLQDPFQATDPCNNRTCPNDPDALCAVVNQCGTEVPIFINLLGQIVDCGETTEQTTYDRDSVPPSKHTGSSADTDIMTLACQGYCEFDPCEGQTCPPHPDAMCVQSGCDCQPIWLLDVGVQVNCTTGAYVEPSLSARKRRQAAAIIPSSCSS